MQETQTKRYKDGEAMSPLIAYILTVLSIKSLKDNPTENNEDYCIVDNNLVGGTPSTFALLRPSYIFRIANKWGLNDVREKEIRDVIRLFDSEEYCDKNGRLLGVLLLQHRINAAIDMTK